MLYTKVQAEALVAHVPCVIGMPDAIGDKAAIAYAADLYLALAFGKSVASAHQCGLAALAARPLNGPARDLELTETAEMALRASTPEVLTQVGHDARSIYIVPGVEGTQISSIPSEETRIHLEITIDTEFETVDAEALGRIVMDFCRLGGGQPVKIICIRKGSLRVTLSRGPRGEVRPPGQAMTARRATRDDRGARSIGRSRRRTAHRPGRETGGPALQRLPRRDMMRRGL